MEPQLEALSRSAAFIFDGARKLTVPGSMPGAGEASKKLTGKRSAAASEESVSSHGVSWRFQKR
ncbi:hypothetical protein RKD29_000020 [Streptomyces tendae]|uniref:hypothetical protein n=1 Tax=Streptomyces tendae TaxID=1932 RepID=UPI0038386068